MEKRYIGDAVYVDHDGYHLVLTTENGIETTNTIYLESAVIEALVQYIKDLEREAALIANGTEALPE